MVFLVQGMVPPGRFQATCVSGAPPGPDHVLQGQQKQNQAQEKSPDRAMANTSAMALGTKPMLLYHISIWHIFGSVSSLVQGHPVGFRRDIGTPPLILGSGNANKDVLEVKWMVLSGYLPL